MQPAGHRMQGRAQLVRHRPLEPDDQALRPDVRSDSFVHRFRCSRHVSCCHRGGKISTPTPTGWRSPAGPLGASFVPRRFFEWVRDLLWHAGTRSLMIPGIPAGHNTAAAPDRLLRWSVLALFLLALLATIHFPRGLLLPIAIGTILALTLEPL